MGIAEQAAKAALTRAKLDQALKMAGIRRRLTLLEDFPKIVCLCGSTRFSEAFRDANLKETLEGNIVLSIGCGMRSDDQIWAGKDEMELAIIKQELDQLHRRKIELTDEVLILNVGGYIGKSTREELEYATRIGRKIRFLEGT